VAMAKMQTWVTGSKRGAFVARTEARTVASTVARTRATSRGFSLVELLVALAIAGMLMAVAVPASVRFYDSMQERQALRATLSIMAAARARALYSGRAQDVMVRPASRRIWFADRERRIPASLTMTVHGAAELNVDDTGVIRFYPEGGSSGGGVDLRRADGSGSSVNVDWLVGTVTLSTLGEGG
jgi:general secretion pathway protein H